MSDKVVVMADGEIQQIGTPEEIYNEPKNLFVADFIGESNIFKGVMTDYMKARFCGTVFDCVDDYNKGMVIDAVVRPEDIVITDEDKGQIKGEVIASDFKGTFYIVVVQSGKKEIEIHSLKNYCLEHITQRVSEEKESENPETGVQIIGLCLHCCNKVAFA